MNASNDIAHMRHALRMAQRSLGSVAPNPAVGCIIVDDCGRIVGRGHTQAGGRPHAETVALGCAGARARGATAYVTLEPCAHHGETPPCAEALISAGIARVVVAVEDPDERVMGRGLARLRESGIAVVSGLLGREAAELNAGFFMRVARKRPLVTLKMAQSLDGRIASASGESRWITGAQARAYGHFLRARHDAILIGIETALVDDPELTCRVAGLERRSPLRVVLDSRLRLPEGSNIARTAREVPTVVFTTSTQTDKLSGCGIVVEQVARDARGRPDLAAVLEALARRGITRLLVEGGAGIHAAFLDRGLADRLEVFRAPVVIGGGGHPAVEALAAIGLDEAPKFRSYGVRRLGSDVLESFAASA